ncbi:magnesium chelatase domain-containing protein [Nocardia sp. CA-135398]|uniref:magnesium chelatase domain-containing protein n=1 Tax=Nocardia sp. CA-135398 TaxID=3239977 RepID=UPI003D973D8F
MIDFFAWTLTAHADTAEVALVAASPAAVADPVADAPTAHPLGPEVRARVYAAVHNSGAHYPPEGFRLYRLGTHETSPLHDLAAAVTIVALATAPDWRNLDQVVFLAELCLDGKLRPASDARTIAAVTSAVTAAAQARFRYAVLAAEHAAHLPPIEGITVLGASTLREVLNWLHPATDLLPRADASVALSDIGRPGTHSNPRAIGIPSPRYARAEVDEWAPVQALRQQH